MRASASRAWSGHTPSPCDPEEDEVSRWGLSCCHFTLFLQSFAFGVVGGDVILFHPEPLPHWTVSLLGHSLLLLRPSLQASLLTFVGTFPAPQFLEGKGLEPALSINSPVHIVFKVAGDWREHLHIIQQVVYDQLLTDSTPLLVKLSLLCYSRTPKICRAMRKLKSKP